MEFIYLLCVLPRSSNVLNQHLFSPFACAAQNKANKQIHTEWISLSICIKKIDIGTWLELVIDKGANYLYAEPISGNVCAHKTKLSHISNEFRAFTVGSSIRNGFTQRCVTWNGTQKLRINQQRICNLNRQLVVFSAVIAIFLNSPNALLNVARQARRRDLRMTKIYSRIWTTFWFIKPPKLSAIANFAI